MGSWDFLDTDPSGGFGAANQSDDFFSIEPMTGVPRYAPSRGLFGDMASNLGRGGVEAFGLLGHSLDQFGLETGLEEWANSAEDRYMFMRPDLEEASGQEGWFKRSAMGALRSAPATAVPLVAAGAGTLMGTPVLGAAAGIGTLVGMFGAGTYNQTYREAIEQGVDEDTARSLALEIAAWEVGTEGLSDAAAVFTGGLLGAPIKGITKGLKGNIKPTLKSIMQAGAPNFLRATGVNVGAEVGSESLNSFMQTKAQIKAGLDPGLTPTQAALASIGPSLFLSGGITLGTQGMGVARRNQLVNILKNENTPTDLKARASLVVEDALRKENPGWADNWKQVSDHIIRNDGVFDINQDFINQATKLTQSQEAVADERETAEVKETTDIFDNPDAVIEEALLGEREARGLEAEAPRPATAEEQLDALISDMAATGILSPEISKQLLLPETTTADPDEVIYSPFEGAVQKLLPAPQPKGERAAEQAGVFGTGVRQEIESKKEAEAAAQAEQEQFEADRGQSIIDYQTAFLNEGAQKRQRRSITEYSRAMLAASPSGIAKSEAAKKARETREKLELLGVPATAELAPELFEAVEKTDIEAVREEGFSAVEVNIPSEKEITPLQQIRTVEEGEITYEGQRTLVPEEKAQLVQAADELAQLQGRVEQERLEAGPEGFVPSVEDQRTMRELEDEINLLAGKTDEDLETIMPGLSDIYTMGEPFAEEASEDLQAAVDTQIEEIQADETKDERQTEAETNLLEGLVTNDEQMVQESIAQYGTTKLEAVITAAERLKQSLDTATDTPGNRAVKQRVYNLLDTLPKKKGKADIPDGFVSWDKVAKNFYTAVDAETGKKYFLAQQAVVPGERTGKWRVYTTEQVGDERTEDTLLISNKGEAKAAFMKRFYRESGEGPFVRKALTAAPEGSYTTSARTKNYWESQKGEMVVVPRSKGGTWGVLRTADFEQWKQLSPKERRAAWYLLGGKGILTEAEAKKLVRQEEGALIEERVEPLKAESAALRELREQQQVAGLEMGSKGPTKGKAPRARGAAEWQERTLAEDIPSTDVIIRKGQKELKSGKVVEVKGEKYVTKSLLYRIESKRQQAAQELKTKLDNLATRYVQAFNAGKLGEMNLLRKEVFDTFGVKNEKKAPKELTENIDRFLNGAMAFTYQTYQTEKTALDSEIAKTQKAKEAVQSQKKTTTLDDTTRYDSQIRQFNRELNVLRNRASALDNKMKAFVKKAATHSKTPANIVENLLKTFSKRAMAVFDETTQPLIELPKGWAASQIRVIDNTPIPHGIVAVPTTADKTEVKEYKAVAREKGHTIWKTDDGFIVETPDGAVTKVYKTQAGAQRFVIDKVEVRKIERETAETRKRYHADFQTEGGNGWSAPRKKDPHFPDYLGVKEGGVLKSDNGKFTAVLTAVEKDSPFLPDYIWEVKDNKGEVVAKFRHSSELVNAINGATKTGYISKRAKGTAKFFSIGEATETKTGNTAKGVANKLARFLGKEGTRKWTGRLTVVQSLDEASGVGTEIKSRGIEGPVLGYYNPATNSVTLVADSIAEGQEQDVFLHEGLHFVMENDGEFVRTKNALLKRITTLKNRSGAVQNAWMEASEKNPDASEEVLAEEAYAYLLQNPDNRKVGVVRQALAAIKRFLIKMRIPVGALGLTDGDLVSIATKSISNLRNVKEMDDANRSFVATQYAPVEVRRKKMESQKFRNFFRNSLVKERGGATAPPIIMYNASSAPNVIPEQSTQTLGQEQDPSLMPYLGINLTSEDTAMEQADQGSVFGYYVRAENPRRMTAKQLNAGIATPEDAQARKRVFELDGHDSIFIMSGTGPNAVVERVIVFNQNQIQQSEKAWRQVNQASLKFSTADAPAAEVEVPETTPERSQTGEQLSAKSTLQDDGGRRHVFAPITDATPKNSDGKYRSDQVYHNALDGKYYEYTDFNTETQDYDAKREITKGEYDTTAEQYSGEQQQLDEAWHDRQSTPTKAEIVSGRAKDFLKKTKDTAKKLVESISEGVRRISPKAYARLNRMEFNIQDTIKDYGKRALPFLKKYDTLSGKDKFILDQALRNGDFRARNRVLTANGMQDEWNSIQGVLDEIKQGALETGLISDEQLLKNYFPRAIKTGKVDHLIASMRAKDSDFSTVLGDEMDKLAKTIEAEGRKMTEADRLAHIQKMMNTGHYQFIPKPGASKDRSITSVLREQAEFYDNSAAALEGHIYDMVQGIEYRRLLGKNNLSRPIQMKELQNLVKQIDELEGKENRSEKENEELKSLKIFYESKAAGLEHLESDLKESIAGYVDEELGKGNENASELIHLIRARLTQRGTHGTWGTVRDIGYMFTLGSPMSAITQLGDLALSAYANNRLNTTAAIFSQMLARVTGSSRMTKDYFDFSHSLGDFSRTGVENLQSQKALDKVLTWSGLKGMDLFGKDVFLQSAMWKNADMSKAEFVKKKAFLFDGDVKRAGRAWKDIKDRNFDNKNRDALFVLFNDLSQWQPISLSEMPAIYNTSGNGRIFYMLKSFNLKALNGLWRDSIGVMLDKNTSAAEKLTASGKGVALVLMVSLAGAGADEIKDFILGKEVDFEDNWHDNLWSFFLMNRFTLEKGIKQGKFFSSIVQGQLPPVRFADVIIDDMGKAAFDPENFKFKSVGLVPVIGRIRYSRMEGGRESELANRKRNLYDEIRENARMNQALYAGTVRERLKIYNELAKQLGEDRLGYKQLKNVRSKERKKVREEARS